jgi:hypothetical protein
LPHGAICFSGVLSFAAKQSANKSSHEALLRL